MPCPTHPQWVHPAEDCPWCKQERHQAAGETQLDALHLTNDAIQDWINAHPDDLPTDFLKLLTDLDFILNGP
jgi:hypothetical protein